MVDERPDGARRPSTRRGGQARTIRLVLALGALLAPAAAPPLAKEAGQGAGARPHARACDARERAALLAPATGSDDSVNLTCSVTLGPGDRVERRVVIAGAEASGVTLDCDGATIGAGGEGSAGRKYTVEIRSKPLGAGPDGRPRWSRPSDVTLARCTILGHVRIWGMGTNGQAEAVRESSHAPGHTERAQAAAPTRVAIRDARLVAKGAIPLYLAPGVTESSLTGSKVGGQSSAVAVYLDAESAGTVIEANDFDIEARREVIAVDGSARNRIAGNRIAIHGKGGVFLYRNCGEGGTVRHQTPSDNLVTGNRFRQTSFFRQDTVVVGSRGGKQSYCGADAGYPFGSSLDDGDHAERNRVEDNREE